LIEMRGLLAHASRLRATHVGGLGYGVAYGSHGNGTAGPSSDLDLLFVGRDQLPSRNLDKLVRDVKNLHRQYGLGLDEEVPYPTKLHATFAQVRDAISLRGFLTDPRGHVTVPRLVPEPWYLDSYPFKLRLLLNALTVPHAFLGGNAAAYQWHCDEASRSVALLALCLLDGKDPFTIDEAIDAMTRESPDGPVGEDFLGYGSDPALLTHLFSVLQRGFARLASESAVAIPDGDLLRQDPRVKRQLVLALAASPMTAA
jgi:hypothetical protein